MPQELHRHIEEQKTACSEIVASKVSSTPLFVHTRYFGAMRVSDPDEADEGAAKNFKDAYVYIYVRVQVFSHSNASSRDYVLTGDSGRKLMETFDVMLRAQCSEAQQWRRRGACNSACRAVQTPTSQKRWSRIQPGGAAVFHRATPPHLARRCQFSPTWSSQEPLVNDNCIRSGDLFDREGQSYLIALALLPSYGASGRLSKQHLFNG